MKFRLLLSLSFLLVQGALVAKNVDLTVPYAELVNEYGLNEKKFNKLVARLVEEGLVEDSLDAFIDEQAAQDGINIMIEELTS